MPLLIQHIPQGERVVKLVICVPQPPKIGCLVPKSKPFRWQPSDDSARLQQALITGVIGDNRRVA